MSTDANLGITSGSLHWPLNADPFATFPADERFDDAKAGRALYTKV